MTGTAGQLRVPTDYLSKVTLPLPPFPEQRRIVERVEALLAQVRASRDRLARVQMVLKRFRQAVLHAAFRGLAVERASSVCALVQSGGTPKGKPFTPVGDIPYLKTYNIVNQEIEFTSRRQFIPLSVHKGELRRSIVLPGDVLMNIVGPPLGKVARVPSSFQEWNINQALVTFRPGSRISSKFLYYFLCEGGEVRRLESQYRGSAGQSNISLSQCRDFLVPVPTLQHQQRIVRRLESLFALADIIARRVEAAQTRAEKLPQAILAKAFSGQLVPTEAELARAEGRTYEAALDLLARIRQPLREPPTGGAGRG